MRRSLGFIVVGAVLCLNTNQAWRVAVSHVNTERRQYCGVHLRRVIHLVELLTLLLLLAGDSEDLSVSADL